VGLSSGFLEPLESTSIHLIHVAILKLLHMFPHRQVNPVIVDQFNREMDGNYDHIRNFLIAHYKVTERADTPFWQYCREMSIPDALADKLSLFRERGEMYIAPDELFKETSWFAILYGQGLTPQSYHPIADALSDDELQLTMARIRDAIKRRAESLPSHGEFIQHCCAARQAVTA